MADDKDSLLPDSLCEQKKRSSSPTEVVEDNEGEKHTTPRPDGVEHAPELQISPIEAAAKPEESQRSEEEKSAPAPATSSPDLQSATDGHSLPTQATAPSAIHSTASLLTHLPGKLVHKVVEKIHATTESISSSIGSSSPTTAAVRPEEAKAEGQGNDDQEGGKKMREEDGKPSKDAKGAKPQRKASAEKASSKASTSSADGPPPTLYQKFVTSIGAALHDLTSEFDEQGPRQRLPTMDLQGVANYICEESPKNVLFMVGAGISTSAGVPDFRTPNTGLYAKLERFKLKNPQMIFDIGYFRRNPEPFYEVFRELFLHSGVRPTISHHFMRLMDEKGVLRRCFTQNIDSLEYLAGIREDKVVTAHGSHQTSTCLACKRKFSREWLEEQLLKSPLVPRCDSCNGVVKPDIVFFGEALPDRFFSSALIDFPKCDLLVIMGTSLVVQPFASMVGQVAKDCPRLLINMTPAGRSEINHYGSGSEALKYGTEGNIRDVFWQGTCDDGALQLARFLGWEEELKALAAMDKAKAASEGKESQTKKDEENKEVLGETSAPKIDRVDESKEKKGAEETMVISKNDPNV